MSLGDSPRPQSATRQKIAPRARASLVRRLVILAAVWSLAVLLAGGAVLSIYFSNAAVARFDNSLADTLDGLLATTSVRSGQILAPTNTDPRSARAYSGSYWQVAAAEKDGPSQMVRSPSLFDGSLPLPPGGLAALEQQPGKVIYYDTPGPQDGRLRAAAMVGRLPDVAQAVVFMAALDRAPLDREIQTFATTISVVLVVLGVGLILAVVIQVRVGLRPLFDLRNDVAAVRNGVTDRLVGDYPTELAPLAEELNALMAHTQDVVERQRTHVGNLAHALKTPLAVMLTEADQQPGPLAQIVSRQAQAMEQHVSHHLRRARAAASAQSHGERTELAPVVEDLTRTLDRIFHEKVATGVDWTCDDGLYFRGERQDLMEIIGNVTENACKWCRSKVRIDVAIAEAPRWLRIVIEDDGPGLSADQHAEALKRGARLDEQTPGTGLGLAIVDELVRAYQGSIELATSTWGGLKVSILLPRAET